MRILAITMIALVFLALVVRFWGGSLESTDVGYTLADSYTLVVKPQAGREFNFGKSLTYMTSEKGGKIFFRTFHLTGGMFNRSSMSHTITVDSRTLAGTWVAEVNGSSQGGDVLLVANAHGFEIISTNLFGPHTGKPPVSGQLIALP